jgi:hypothetical protein
VLRELGRTPEEIARMEDEGAAICRDAGGS